MTFSKHLLSGSRRCTNATAAGAPRRKTAGPARRPSLAARSRRTSRPSARCATTPASAATCVSPRPAGCGSTAPRVASEGRLDGKFLLSTSDPDISAEDVALGYKNLLEAERSFRELKGILRLRPIFHRLEERIRAHILICWLALLLVRLCERPAGDSWRNLRRELERLHLVMLAGAAGQVQQTTQLTPEQREILARLQIEPPPRLTSLTPG